MKGREILEKKVSSGRWKTVYYVDSDENIIARDCRRCGETKPMDNFYIDRKKNPGFNGRKSVCIDCELAANRDYHRSDKERTAARRAKWVKANRDVANSTQREWLARNKDRVNEKRKTYDAYSIRCKRVASLPHDWNDKDESTALQHFGGCALTGDSERIQFDHVIPVATECGGTVNWNMIPLRADLNVSKGHSNIFEWFRENKDRFNLSEERFDAMVQYLSELRGESVEEYTAYVYSCFTNKTIRRNA